MSETKAFYQQPDENEIGNQQRVFVC